MKFLLIGATVKYCIAFYFHKLFFFLWISSTYERYVVFGNNKCPTWCLREKIVTFQFTVLNCADGGRLGQGGEKEHPGFQDFGVQPWLISGSGRSTTALLPSLLEHTSLTSSTLSCSRHTWFSGLVIPSFTVVWHFLFAAACHKHPGWDQAWSLASRFLQ